MTYVCVDCGSTFEDPARWEERHGFDHGPFEQWSGCPYCGESYVEAKSCNCCGELITDKYVKIGAERYCQECFTIMDVGDED